MPDFALHVRRDVRLLVPVTKQARIYASTTLEPWEGKLPGHYLMGRAQAAMALRLLRRRGFKIRQRRPEHA